MKHRKSPPQPPRTGVEVSDQGGRLIIHLPPRPWAALLRSLLLVGVTGGAVVFLAQQDFPWLLLLVAGLFLAVMGFFVWAIFAGPCLRRTELVLEGDRMTLKTIDYGRPEVKTFRLDGQTRAVQHIAQTRRNAWPQGIDILAGNQRVHLGDQLSPAETEWLIGRINRYLDFPADAEGLSTHVSGAPTGSIPYGIHQRPQPSDPDWETLLPRRVGGFQREPIEVSQGANAPEAEVAYTSGKETLLLSAGIYQDPEEAQRVIQVAWQEVRAGDDLLHEETSLNTEPSFCKAVTRRPFGAFMAWTRGRHFFAASTHGNHAGQVLDRFMQSFPY